MKSHGIQMRLAQLGLARRVCGAALLLLLISAETQASFIVVLDDRAAFELLLTVSPASTVIDSAGNFAGDPVAGTVDFVQRSGSLHG
jgi:hypothetical protein